MLESIVSSVNSFVWGPPMIALLIGSHLFLTVRTGFIQRKIPAAIKMSFKKDPNAPGDISQFGALATSLSATLGTGNIVGVATAVIAGGPGAILWMWLTGVFGIATKYAETFISFKYRVKDHKGNMLGGAMYAWRRGFEKNGKAPWWAMLGAGAFALFAAIASFGIGSAVQAATVADIVSENFPSIPDWGVGAALVIMVTLVMWGGVQGIARVCEKTIPFIALAYTGGCVIIIAMNAQYILPALQLIVTCAFTAEAAFGGAVGSGIMMALQFGCARGLFSNESGMGSAPIISAAASANNPARQSLVAMTATFWDTVVVCALTGLVLITTMLANPGMMEAGTIKEGAQLTSAAFATIPYIGTPILVFGSAMFTVTTILGWSYYGNRCMTYLFGKRAILPYQVIYITAAFLGAVGVEGVVWSISDTTNALMAIPNIICVLLLSGMIAKETKHYVWKGNLDEKADLDIPTVDTK